ncbi:PDZ domain-containing protein [Streptomyces sp. NPDC018693]|uniref:PDZ domain-containing protein n=1 Tax=unclassified Streptomyces TaxID=2593676 RepID=UPI0037ADA5FE
MEQTALRPKPLPGQEPGPDGGDGGGGGARGGGTGGRPGGPARRPHAARRRGRRLTTLLFGLFLGTVLVLAGVGLGTVGAAVIGMSKLAELQRQAAAQGGPGGAPSPSAPSASPEPAPAGATLGLEIVDGEKSGAKVVAVHVPGPGYTAGLVRGDVLLWFGGTRVGSATDLVRAVAEARPGKRYKVTVRHRSGGYQQLVVVPGVVT